MNFLLNLMPPELHALPVLIAGFVALLGLVLWSAGIIVARPMAAALLGAVLAAVAVWLLPTFTGLAQIPSALIGLVAGLVIGAFAFRALQGVILATALGIAASGSFYSWEIGGHRAPAPQNVAATLASVSQTVAQTSLPAPNAGAPTWIAFVNHTLQTATAQWLAIPATLRQSMIVIATGVAILALAIAWIIPRYTTWLTTAAAGTALLLIGGLALLSQYGAPYEKLLPAAPTTRAGIIAILVLAGMLVQRLFFWPGKRQQQERAKDHAAAPA